MDNNKTYLLRKNNVKNGFVTFREDGKVILPVNDNLKPGFAVITKIIAEKEKVVLAQMENVVEDYFENIDYDTFKQVLLKHNYKIGYESPFIFEGKDEMQIFAYNMSTGIIIVGDSWDNKSKFNSIDVYCPNVDTIKFGNRIPMLISGSKNMSTFNLCFNKNRILYPLSYIHKLKENTSSIWIDNETPSLWTYADNGELKTNADNAIKFGIKKDVPFYLWENTITKIWEVDREIEFLFTNERIQKVFKHNPYKRTIL